MSIRVHVDLSSIPGLEDLLEKEITAHSNILAGKSYGQRSLEGYSPWGHKRVRHDLVTEQQIMPQIPMSSYIPPGQSKEAVYTGLSLLMKDFLD